MKLLKITLIVFGGCIALLILLVVLFFDFHITGGVIDNQNFIQNETTNETELECRDLPDGKKACLIIKNATISKGTLHIQNSTITSKKKVVEDIIK